MFPLIIELIYWSLASNDIRILIFGLLRDYLKKRTIDSISLKQTLKSENVNEDEIDQPFSIFNGNIIKKLIKIITPEELKLLQLAIGDIKNNGKITNKISKKIEKIFDKNEESNIKEIKNKGSKLSNELSEKDEQIKDFYLNNWINLSSSWFKKGYYEINNKKTNLGQLTALFQSDNSKSMKWYGPYTYPAFPVEIWITMTQQKGKNGNGAGTIFWRYWNKIWLPSQIRKYVKERLKKSKGIIRGNKNDLGLFAGITAQELLPFKNINIAKTNAYIYRLEKNFPKLKKTINDYSNINSQKWLENRKEYVKNNSLSKNYYQKYKKNNNLYKNMKDTNKKNQKLINYGFDYNKWKKNN